MRSADSQVYVLFSLRLSPSLGSRAHSEVIGLRKKAVLTKPHFVKHRVERMCLASPFASTPSKKTYFVLLEHETPRNTPHRGANIVF